MIIYYDGSSHQIHDGEFPDDTNLEELELDAPEGEERDITAIVQVPSNTDYESGPHIRGLAPTVLFKHSQR